MESVSDNDDDYQGRAPMDIDEDVERNLAELEEMALDAERGGDEDDDNDEEEDIDSEEREFRRNMAALEEMAAAGQGGDDEDPEIREMDDPDSYPRRPQDIEDEEELADPRAAEVRREKRRRAKALRDYFEDEYGDADPSMVYLLENEEINDILFSDPTRILDLEGEDSDEDEQESAGMILPNLVLADKAVYYRELFRVLCHMGNETTRLLKKILVAGERLTDMEKHRCSVWIRYWTAYLVEHYHDILDQVISMPTGPDGATEKICPSACLIAEIWRNKLIISYETLGQYSNWKISDSEFLVKWLLETPGVPLDIPPKPPILPKPKSGIVSEEDRLKFEKEVEKWKRDYEKFETSRKISETPVIRLKQSQIIRLVQHLTGKLRIIPYCEDIAKLIEVLQLKTAMFFCQTMPGTALNDPKMRLNVQKELDDATREYDEEQAKIREKAMLGEATHPAMVELAEAMREAYESEQKKRRLTVDESADLRRAEDAAKSGGRYVANRDFWIFCSCYFYPLIRATYYVNMFPKMDLDRINDPESYLPKGCMARLKDWCLEMARLQGTKYFERLEDAAREAIADGDLEWLKYRFPEESDEPGVVVRKTRGEAEYEEFHVQTGLSHQAIFSMVGSSWLADTYVLHLFDRYLDNYKFTKFRDGYVIENAFIDDPNYIQKWSNEQEPFLINVFNGYWILFERKVVPINNIYASICWWLMSIEKSRDRVGLPKGCLSDNTSITDIIDKILYGKGVITYSTQHREDQEHREKLARGFAVDETRIRI